VQVAIVFSSSKEAAAAPFLGSLDLDGMSGATGIMVRSSILISLMKPLVKVTSRTSRGELIRCLCMLPSNGLGN